MSKGKLLYAQSGGVTAVINTTAAAVITRARRDNRRPIAGDPTASARVSADTRAL